MDVFLNVDSPSDFSPSQVCVASCPCVVHLGGTKGWCHFLRDALRSLRALDMGHLAGGLFFFFVDFRVTLKVGDVLRWRRPWRGAGLLSLFCKCCVFFGGVSPNNKKCSLIFALSCSSLFCHEVLVGYLVAFTNPREIK